LKHNPAAEAVFSTFENTRYDAQWSPAIGNLAKMCYKMFMFGKETGEDCRINDFSVPIQWARPLLFPKQECSCSLIRLSECFVHCNCRRILESEPWYAGTSALRYAMFFVALVQIGFADATAMSSFFNPSSFCAKNYTNKTGHCVRDLHLQTCAHA